MIPRPVLGLCRSNVADISAPTKGTVTKNSIKVTGTVEWYKDGATWGVAYKKNADTEWTYKASTSKSISETLSSRPPPRSTTSNYMSILTESTSTALPST